MSGHDEHLRDRYVIEGATYDRLEADRDRLRAQLADCEEALLTVEVAAARFREAFLVVAEQLEAAADKFAELSMPVYELACRSALVEATDAAAFDPAYNATVAPSAPKELS